MGEARTEHTHLWSWKTRQTHWASSPSEPLHKGRRRERERGHKEDTHAKQRRSHACVYACTFYRALLCLARVRRPPRAGPRICSYHNSAIKFHSHYGGLGEKGVKGLEATKQKHFSKHCSRQVEDLHPLSLLLGPISDNSLQQVPMVV